MYNCIEMILSDIFGGSSFDDRFYLRFPMEIFNIFFSIDE